MKAYQDLEDEDEIEIEENLKSKSFKYSQPTNPRKMKNYFKILFQRWYTLLLLTPAIILGCAYLVFTAKLVYESSKWIWNLW